MTIRFATLANGLRVVTERMPDVRSVALGFWVGTGSRDEPDDIAGASHFLEHLLFKGTSTRSARDIAEAVDAVGGEMNAFTTKEYTAFYARVLADALPIGLDVMSDLIWDPAFRPADVESERQVILEELLMRGDEPADEVHDVFDEAMWPDHPLGRDIVGTEESVGDVSVDDIRRFFEHHYRPGNMVVAAAGHLDHDDLCVGLESRFVGNGAGSGGAAPVREAPAAVTSGVESAVERPSEQAHLVVGVPALDRSHPDRWALSVLDHALGGGMASRLFQSIREERGLAYSVYSYRSAFEDTGALSVYAGTMPAKADEVLGLIGQELESVAAQGISARELEVAKGHLLGDMALSLEDSAARMSRIGRSMLAYGEVLTFDEIAAAVTAVTLDDVARVAQLLRGPRVTARVGPA